VALARSWRVGINLKDPGGAFLITRVALSLGLYAVFATIEAFLLAPRGERSPGTLWAAHDDAGKPAIRDRSALAARSSATQAVVTVSGGS